MRHRKLDAPYRLAEPTNRRRDEIVQFLQAIDAELALHITHGERLDLYLIGRSAPILRYGLDLATRDIDIVHVHGSALEGRALEQFGKGTRNAERGATGLLSRAGTTRVGPDPRRLSPQGGRPPR